MREKQGYRWNIQNNTLYITKAFERRAGTYGTDEYNIVRDIKKDNPEMNTEYMRDYKAERSKENIHRLKIDFIESEIENSKNQNSVEQLRLLKKNYEGTKFYAGKIKKLYFDTYPEKASLSTLKRKEKAKKAEAEKRKYIDKINSSADDDTADE